MKVFYILITTLLWSQIFLAQSIEKEYSDDIQSIRYSTELQTPAQITLKNGSTFKTSDAIKAISKFLKVDNTELSLLSNTKISPSISIEKYSRSIGGIKAPHCNYTVLYKDNQIESIYAEHYESPKSKNRNIITEAEALTMVLPHLESNLFAWEATSNLLNNYPVGSKPYDKLQKVLIDEYPKGELVYIKDYYTDYSGLELAYFFTIESVIPEFRDRVYVSAADGRILLRDPQLKHGTGDTRYSGTRSYPTTQINGPPGAIYELKGIEPISGVYCETRSLEGIGGLPISSPAIIALSDSIADGDEPDPCLIDNTETIAEFGDDEWDANEHRKVAFTGGAQSCCPAYISGQCDEVRNDDIALDAHWGAAMVLRYFKQIHNRFGYDNTGSGLYSYVHHGMSYENASWNGLFMKYGDGAFQDGNNPGGMFGPLVSLDVCAHEVGHAICTSTSDLVYVGESGAMNEGLSDIWAACIEGFVLDSIDATLDYVPWSIGEQIDQRDGGLFNEPGARALRWMDHPPAENNPDTYGAGTWWQDPDCASPNVANDFCGVHFNSGVLNKWFYLLSVGSGQTYSPGLNKPIADDEINDKGHVYSVSGIGLNKAEKIVYGANLLLLSNSKFADMRAASIDIARSLYGPCSNEFEQTMKAWYAVGVGPNFSTCLPTIEFNQYNISLVTETSMQNGCYASKEIHLSIFSYMANETITFATSGNALAGDDFNLCSDTLNFMGDEEKQLKIIIFDDKIHEGNDTIIVNFTGGIYSDSDTIVIINDDGIPAIGNSSILFFEEFNEDTALWQQELVNPTSMLNEWYIDAGNSNQAHISYTPLTGVPSYSQVVESHIRLKSPLISSLGQKNTSVSFNYMVGGERDLVDTSAVFDFGTFEVSYDGFEWEEIRLFVGNAQAGGMVPDSGNYNVILPQLDNSTFYLGFTWHNDALNGSAVSFMIDSIVIIGEGLEIESTIGATMEAKAPINANIGFISITDNEVIAIIEDCNGDLGCTSLTLVDNDMSLDFVPSVCKQRSSKVFGIETENSTDSIELTLFFKESEIDAWPDFSILNILAVEDINIDSAQANFTIISNAQTTIGDHRDNGNGYVTYTFWIPSSIKSLALTDRPAIPQVLIVTNSSDNLLGSLRERISYACPQDTITFDPVLDGVTIPLQSGSLTIDKDLFILGNGISQTSVYNNNGTTMNILEGVNLFIDNMTIYSETPDAAIHNSANLILGGNVSLGHQ